MSIEVILLILASYLFGSVPAAYLAARWLKGMDLRKYGTGNIGASNLVAATSKRWAVPVIVFDLVKGAGMVWAGWLLDFTLAQQAAVGVAAIAGHNWSVFLRFSSGRGIITTLGIALVLPPLNGYWPFALGIACLIVLVGVFITRSTAPGVLVGLASLPLTSLALREPLSLALAYIAMFLIAVLRRLTAQRIARIESLSRGQILLNRLLFDREIRDKKAWMDLLLSRTGPPGCPPDSEIKEKKG
ncbi:MAG: glycerol-3-phosphate acyltransferase [Chloroflexi bacterium]|nr:glycerol-3-phosphate acyltransferase [Chloroflexota bacterium]